MSARRRQLAAWPRIVRDVAYPTDRVRLEVDVDDVVILRTVSQDRQPASTLSWAGGRIRLDGDLVAETEIALELPAAEQLLAVLAEAVAKLEADEAGRADAPSGRPAPASSEPPTIVSRALADDDGLTPISLDLPVGPAHWPFRGDHRIGRRRG